MDAFLRRVIEIRAAEQQAQEYLRQQPEEPDARNDLGPPVPLLEDWLCRWCGEINRRRLSAEHQPYCAGCFNNAKPCAEYGGPVNKSESGRAAKPTTICKACWRMDSPVLFRQIAKAEEKLKLRLDGTVKTVRRRGRPPKYAHSKPLTKPKRPVVVPQAKPKAPGQATGSVRIQHGSWQARWYEQRKLRSKSFRTKAEAQRFLRAVQRSRRVR